MYLHQLILVVFITCIGVCGIPGNMLVIVVFGKIKSSKMVSTDVFIIALALTGLLFCLLSPVIVFQISQEHNSSIHLCRLYYFEMYFPIYNSTLLCVAIAVDRFLAISKPHKKWFTLFKAEITASITLVLSGIVQLPYFRRVHINIVPHNTSDIFIDTSENFTLLSKAGKEWHICELAQSVTVLDDIVSSITGISYSIWLVIVAILYIKMYLKIRKRMKVHPSRSNKTGSSDTEPASGTCDSVQDPRLSRRGSIVITLGQSETITSNRYTRGEDDNSTLVSDTNITAEAKVDERVPGQLPNQNPRIAVNPKHYFSTTTKMLFAVTLVTFMTWFPSVFAYALKKTQGVGEEWNILFMLPKHLFLISHASNPFIYGIVCKKFRTECLSLWEKFIRKIKGNQ